MCLLIMVRWYVVQHERRNDIRSLSQLDAENRVMGSRSDMWQNTVCPCGWLQTEYRPVPVPSAHIFHGWKQQSVTGISSSKKVGCSTNLLERIATGSESRYGFCDIYTSACKLNLSLRWHAGNWTFIFMNFFLSAPHQSLSTHIEGAAN